MNKTNVYKSFEEFKARPDKSDNGVSEDFAKSNPNYQNDNATNTGCWNCEYCWDCRNCRNCIDCVYAVKRTGCEGLNHEL